MRLDSIPGSARNFPHRIRDPVVLDVGRSPAPRAHQVMVVSGGARDVCVVTRREIHALDDVQAREQVERPKDRRASDTEPLTAGRRNELGSGEVAVQFDDEVRDGASGGCHPISLAVECLDDRIHGEHARNDKG